MLDRKTELTEGEKESLRDLGRLKWFVGTMKVTRLLNTHGIWERAVESFLWELLLENTGRSFEVHYDGQEFMVYEGNPNVSDPKGDKEAQRLIERLGLPWAVRVRKAA